MIIGYTSGVFDLFHIGHLNLLKKAKENCDYLIVAVSTDELVKEYKNKTPVISFEERKSIVEAIRYVDKVIPQTNRDKISTYNSLKFDVMIVGDDWKDSEIFSQVEKHMKKHGGWVKYVPYTNTTSSTFLRQKLNEEE